jgi:hypothetical protein
MRLMGEQWLPQRRGSDGLVELFAWSVLQEIAGRAGPNGAQDVRVGVVGGERFHRGMVLCDLDGGGERRPSAATADPSVPRPKAVEACELYGLCAGRGFSYDFQRRRGLCRLYPSPREGIIAGVGRSERGSVGLEKR